MVLRGLAATVTLTPGLCYLLKRNQACIPPKETEYEDVLPFTYRGGDSARGRGGLFTYEPRYHAAYGLGFPKVQRLCWRTLSLIAPTNRLRLTLRQA